MSGIWMRAVVGLIVLASAGWAAEPATDSSLLSSDIDAYLDRQQAVATQAPTPKPTDLYTMFSGEDPDWFMATAGVWWGKLTGPITFDGGTVLDVSEVFGLDDRTVIPFVRLGFRLWRFEFILEGWWYSQDGTTVVEEEFEIDGEVFEIGDTIDSRITLNTYRFALGFEFWQADAITVTGMLGLTLINTTGRVNARSTTGDAHWNEWIPVPAIGLNLAGNPWKKLIYEFEVNWIGISQSAFSIAAWDIRAAVGWQFNDWFLTRVGYRFVALEGTLDVIGVDLQLEGFYIELAVTF